MLLERSNESKSDNYLKLAGSCVIWLLRILNKCKDGKLPNVSGRCLIWL